MPKLALQFVATLVLVFWLMPTVVLADLFGSYSASECACRIMNKLNEAFDA